MENINIEIKFKLAVLCAAFGFLLGLLTVDFKDLAKSDDLSLSVGLGLIFGILGFSVLPMIIFEFAGSFIKLYLLSGPIGIAFIRLALKIFSSDGNLSKKDAERILLYMKKEFGNTVTAPLLDYLSENRKLNYRIEDTCKPLIEIKLSGRIDILHKLMMLLPGNRISGENESSVLHSIAKCLKISEKRFEMIRNAVLKEKGIYSNSEKERKQNDTRNFYIMDQLMKMAYNPFKILGLEQNASNDEVKQAYRKMVKIFHPDKSMHKGNGQDIVNDTKIVEINEAYKSIKKLRGMK